MHLVPTNHLDCRGMVCPLPIIQTSRALRAMQAGQLLRVEAEDAAFGADLDAWLSTRADELVSFETGNGVYRALIRKGGSA